MIPRDRRGVKMGVEGEGKGEEGEDSGGWAGGGGKGSKEGKAIERKGNAISRLFHNHNHNHKSSMDIRVQHIPYLKRQTIQTKESAQIRTADSVHST